MSQVIINDIPPYTQGTASGGQTVFGTTWTANYASDVVVYVRPAGSLGDDALYILSYPSQYSVAFIGGDLQVQVTLVTPSTAGDIVTITRQTPADRENLYSNTNFVPSMLNNDFGILTLVDQQAQLVNQLIGPRYNYSSVILPIIDTMLPILPANCTWVKNPTNTGIVPYELPQSAIAPAGDTYITVNDETATLPNSSSLDLLGLGIMVSGVGPALIKRSISGTTNQITLTNGDGVSGNPTVSIAPNAILPGNGGLGIPQGTTAQRIIPVSGIGLRYNTDIGEIEYWNGVTWSTISSDSSIFAILASHMLGQGAALIGLQGAGTVQNLVPPDYITLTNQTPLLPNSHTLASLALLLNGGTMAGAINMGNFQINNLATPTANHDAATKLYVDLTLGTNIPLTHNYIFVGNGSNIAVGVPVSGDVSVTDTGVVTVNKIGGMAVSLGGSFSTIGAFSLGFNLTGNTLVTLPTSGTLATTDGSLSTINTDSTPATVALGAMTLTGGATGLTLSGAGSTVTLAGTLGVLHGGTGVTSVTVVPTASSFAGWDVNYNMSAVGFIAGYNTTATAGATTTLTVGSAQQQYFTGALNQTVQMPVANTCVEGQGWIITNDSAGIVTVNSSGGNLIIVLPALAQTTVTCVLNSGTTAASWSTTPLASGSGTVSAGLVNQVAWYASSGDTVSGLATLANAVLATSVGSVPALTTTLPSAVQLNITQLGTQSQLLNMGGFLISNLADPLSANDAANKQYVDNISAGLNPIPGVYAASTADLTGYTYNNGAAGVGATLTAPGIGVFSIDGVSPPVNQTILYKNDTTGLGTYNGIYKVTTSSAGVPAVLTRSAGYDTPAEIQPGDLIAVENGTANAGSSFIQTATIVTVGVTPLTFSAFFSPANYLQVTNNLSDVANKATGRTNLGVQIGLNVQAWSSILDSVVAGTYVGSTSITTLGTIGTGVWQGTDVGLGYGGTGASLSASNGGIVWTNASAMQVLSGTSTANQLLLSGASASPLWSTSTYPTSNAANTLLYASAANVMSALATANSGVLVTSGAGVPSILAAGTTGQILQASTAGTPSWSTPTYPSVSGTSGKLLTSDGTNVVYTTSTYPLTNAISTLLYASAANVMSALATANGGTLCTSNAGVPFILAGPGFTGAILQSRLAGAPAWSTASYPITVAVNTILYASSADNVAALATANNGVLVTGPTTGTPSILAGPGTTGNILRSNAAAAPSFSTSTYPSTNAISTLLYASAANVMSALATANNGLLVTSNSGVPSILAGSATGGVCLLSNTAAAPSWSTNPPITKIVVQRVTATGAGTYTPTTGMQYVLVDAMAAGGGGGGAATTTASQFAAAGGGSGGEYIQALFTAANIGASKAYSVGAKGTGGAAGNNNGTGGGNTTFNTTWIIATGGGLGVGCAATAAIQMTGAPVAGGSGGSVATGTLLIQSAGGSSGVGFSCLLGTASGASGGNSGLGAAAGRGGFAIASGVAGLAAGTNSGAGGGGAGTGNGTQAAGGNGGDGFLVFTEYCSV